MSKRLLPISFLSADGSYAAIPASKEVLVIDVGASQANSITLNHGISLVAFSHSGKRAMVGSGSKVTTLNKGGETTSIRLDTILLRHLAISDAGLGLAVTVSEVEGAYLRRILLSERIVSEPIFLGKVEIYGVDLADDGLSALFWGRKSEDSLLRLVDLDDTVSVAWTGNELSISPTGGALRGSRIIVYDNQTILLIDAKAARTGVIAPHKIDMGGDSKMVCISPNGNWLAWSLSGDFERRVVAYDSAKSESSLRGVLSERLFHESLAIDDAGQITYAGTRHPDEVYIAVEQDGLFEKRFTKKIPLGVFKSRDLE